MRSFIDTNLLVYTDDAVFPEMQQRAVQAAASAGCTVLLSEDMQHGEVVSGVRIENPFL